MNPRIQLHVKNHLHKECPLGEGLICDAVCEVLGGVAESGRLGGHLGNLLVSCQIGFACCWERITLE